MRHDVLVGYLQAVEQAITDLPSIHVEQYQEEWLTPMRINLRIRVRSANGGLLEINEAVVVESGILVWLGYRYHCQDAQNRLVFRYDDTPHFPDLPSFPHHKHLLDHVISAEKPTVFQVITECGRLIL